MQFVSSSLDRVEFGRFFFPFFSWVCFMLCFSPVLSESCVSSEFSILSFKLGVIRVVFDLFCRYCYLKFNSMF